MIATGGLLRINARRQDSLKAKPHRPHTHKRKTKKKRRSEVVVVKGKLKLCSVSGLVAALGILVLLVGVVMAALGYWPRDGLFFRAQTQESVAMVSVSSISSTPAPADTQGGKWREELPRGERDNRGGASDDALNQTEPVNGTTQRQRGILEDFLDRYLYSDRLKVFGPLIMGIGIFLFICANAVLHENRDKKTKVINLRDIYSTVIDLHSLRRPNTSSFCSARRFSANPLNGLVNYVQSKSLESKPSAFPASLMTRREDGGGEGGGGVLSRQHLCGSSRGQGGVGSDGGDTVFSIYQEHPDVSSLPDSSSHRFSLPPSFSLPPISTCWTSLQKEELSFFTLPLRRSQLPTPRRRHSARARTGQGWGEDRGGEEVWSAEGGDRQEDACPPPPLCSSTLPPPRPFRDVPSAASCSSSSLHREVPVGSQALLLLSSSSLTPSHLSLSSLSHLLSSSSSMLVPPRRRRSLPTANIITGYSKLTHREDDSFESTKITSSHHVTSQGRGLRSEEMTSQRKYSSREKLRMISVGDSGLRQNKEEEG